MARRIAILGASMGGMVAAAELRKQGCDVTVFEKARGVGGLYSKVETPFGNQELGMHVLYVDGRHYAHLCDIFGRDSFHVMRGPRVDVGASANFGGVYWGSHYPSLLGHPLRERVLGEILQSPTAGELGSNAHEEALRRFGYTAAHEVFLPILRKLWAREPCELSSHALHCFFDLRRIVVVGKDEADRLKDNPELDAVIANPVQSRPKGTVFDGRMALVFREGYCDPSDRAIEWAERSSVTLRFGSDVSVAEGSLCADGVELNRDFDACLVALPSHALAGPLATDADKAELSIYYCQLEKPLADQFPAYYILAHDPSLITSRIVNYDGYRPRSEGKGRSVLGIESVHPPGKAPAPDTIAAEVLRMLPDACVAGTFQLPRSLPVPVPSLANGWRLDAFEQSIAGAFGKPVYFTGMRTDTGVFFSHHTIGLAYDSTLALLRRLA